ncbi:MAG: glycosyltransferase [Candidatus Thermoplasmatota archaeon]|nr:glycosyltransferase [Candidatus Thermoplasmatota archaeon]
MKEPPIVSVIMPVYNNEKYLRESIESILNQTYTNFEFIIIDDCSSDSSWDIIQIYSEKDPRIIPIKNEKNLKIPKTRNKGIKISKGKYIVVQDGDDVSCPDRIEKQVEFMEKHTEYGALGSNMYVIDSNSEVIGERIYINDFKKIKKAITRYNPIAQPSVIIRNSLLKNEIGNYNEDLIRCSDYDLWIRIGLKYKIGNLQESLVKYRRSDDQGLITNYNKSLKFTLFIQKKYLFVKYYFNIWNVFLWISKHILLILPKNIVIFIIDKHFYNRKKRK